MKKWYDFVLKLLFFKHVVTSSFLFRLIYFPHFYSVHFLHLTVLFCNPIILSYSYEFLNFYRQSLRIYIDLAILKMLLNFVDFFVCQKFFSVTFNFIFFQPFHSFSIFQFGKNCQIECFWPFFYQLTNETQTTTFLNFLKPFSNFHFGLSKLFFLKC